MRTLQYSSVVEAKTVRDSAAHPRDTSRFDYHRYQVAQKPKLGQNFLVDEQAAHRIVAALGDLAGHTVVEIGAGRGAITGLLAKRAGRVLAIELDHALAENLRSRFAPEHVAVVERDIMAFDFAAAEADAGGPLRVVGNLPYYITSPIILRLAASHTALDLAVLMVQREVADRVTAQPGSRDYGLLSATVQLYGAAEPLFTLPPAAFTPAPKVHSTVFRWRFAPRLAELAVDETGFLRFLRQAFAQKRKTLGNNLRAAGLSPAAAASALAQAGIDPRTRAEALPLETLAALWRGVNRESTGFPG